MGKRGDISLWFLVEFVGAFLIAFFAIDFSVNIAHERIYEKLNIAKELSMQINALSSVPGNAYIINNNLHGYSIYFSDNKVEVYDDTFDQLRGVYHFAKIGNSKIELKFDKPKQLVISKISNEIRITEEIPKLK